jgi:hypothetical protein
MHRTFYLNMFFLCSVTSSLSARADNRIKVTLSFTPSGSFEAVSEKLKGNVVKKNGILQSEKLWVDARTFRTDVQLRDEHFSNHLRNSRIIMTDIKARDGEGEGTLEINQVKKPIRMRVTDLKDHVEVNFEVDAAAFNLPKANFLGIGVSDHVKVWAIAPYTNYNDPEQSTTTNVPAASAAKKN